MALILKEKLMNKYIFWSVLMSAIFFTALCCHASEFFIIGKHSLITASEILKNKGYKITAVQPLDMEVDGFLLITFE